MLFMYLFFPDRGGHSPMTPPPSGYAPAHRGSAGLKMSKRVYAERDMHVAAAPKGISTSSRARTRDGSSGQRVVGGSLAFRRPAIRQQRIFIPWRM